MVKPTHTYANLRDGDLLPIGAAARWLGVSVSTLRRYDKDGLIVPVRTAGGQRRFSGAALKALRDRTAVA